MKRDDVRRGMVLAAPGTITMTDSLQAKLYFLTPEEGGVNRPFLTSLHVDLFFNASDIKARIEFDDKEMVLPGEDITGHVGVGHNRSVFSKN